MKTFARVIAVVMIVAVLASLMTACGDKGYMDKKLIGTWTQTDDKDGNWTWTFKDDNTCRLVGENFDSEGTYKIENESTGKIHIKLKDWSEEKLFSYVATSKVLDLEGMDSSYYCKKQ